MSVNDKQVGGRHYKDNGDFQHWDVVTALNWDYLVGAATKYLWRLGRKGDTAKSIEDIDKAIHYLEKKKELLQLQLDSDRLRMAKIEANAYTVPQAVVNVPYDLKEWFTEEGYLTDGKTLYTCKTCGEQNWLTQNGAIEHLALHVK